MALNPTAPAAPGIRRAGAEDREWIASLLGEAFHEDPVSSWVFPEERRRRELHPRFFGVFLGAALAEGAVEVTEDRSAAALWLDVPAVAEEDVPAAIAEDDEVAALMRKESDPENERAETVGRLTARVHPRLRAHRYLMLLGVEPDRQGQGLGSALLAPALRRCDAEGVPAYLEASNARSRALYEREGFRFTGRTVDLPGGPPMWPMWREPRG
ncbi:GNAT family N-acetyltransferase [Streptomyces sp. Ru87]|uniref:GNAT family N-acetyltransferase n=1 Tax=Streptomyces sp. Ru87 TaxID=2044307 RepID=UPI000BF4964C|nr:GNAT family N-acetyltransferase [Streptomyces sp. Ru87]PGH52309.1 GNAT family N-acetyltransferase [Streptomyces sp. Ru87]